MTILRMLPFAQSLIGSVLNEGDAAIDGTVGNGHDTLFLAEAVGSKGKVFGFDVQEAALKSASEKLKAAGVEKQATFILAGHETMAQHIPTPLQGKIKGAMFNLGYLPGSDKNCITSTESTVSALKAALDFLAPSGILTVMVYPSHEGGDEEAKAVMEWARELSTKSIEVLRYDFINRKEISPSLIAIEKKKA